MGKNLGRKKGSDFVPNLNLLLNYYSRNTGKGNENYLFKIFEKIKLTILTASVRYSYTNKVEIIMTLKKLEDLLLCTLYNIVSYENDEVAQDDISLDTNPVKDFCLESDDGVSWACDIASEGIIIPNSLNPFYDSTGKKAVTVKDLAKRLISLQDGDAHE